MNAAPPDDADERLVETRADGGGRPMDLTAGGGDGDVSSDGDGNGNGGGGGGGVRSRAIGGAAEAG